MDCLDRHLHPYHQRLSFTPIRRIIFPPYDFIDGCLILACGSLTARTERSRHSLLFP